MECEARRELLQAIVSSGPVGYTSRLQTLKKMARRYHSDPLARSILDEAIAAAQRLQIVEDEAIEIFRESFIAARDGPRRISEQHYMSPRTVQRIQAKVFERLMPLIFGIDGLLFK